MGYELKQLKGYHSFPGPVVCAVLDGVGLGKRDDSDGKAYLEHLGSTGKSNRTLYTYGKDFEQIEAFFGEKRQLSKILPAHVGKFLKSDELLTLPSGKERAKPTVEKTVRVMRMFFVWCVETGRIKKLPLPKAMPMGRSATPVVEGEQGDSPAAA